MGSKIVRLYVETKQHLPEEVLQVLKRIPLARSLARTFEPTVPTILPLTGLLGGYRMEVGPPYHGMMVYGHYEPAVCQLIQNLIKPGWTVIDVGAHIGYMTLLMARSVGESGRVIAFEPLPENVVSLRKNIALNGLDARVLVEHAAVAEVSGQGYLQLGSTSSQAALGKGKDGIMTRTWSLDEYALARALLRIHFVKIDAEGAEVLVLKGMKEVLARSYPLVLLEIHGDPQARYVVESMPEYGYTLRQVNGDSSLSPVDPAGCIDHPVHWIALPEQCCRHISATW